MCVCQLALYLVVCVSSLSDTSCNPKTLYTLEAVDDFGGEGKKGGGGGGQKKEREDVLVHE